MSEPARRYELPHFDGQQATAASRRSPPTAGELEAIEERAYAEGWEKGRAEGYAAGERELREAVARVDALAAALSCPLEALDEQLHAQLRDLATQIGEALARHTLRATPAAVAALVTEAVGLLAQDQGAVHVALHPQDRAQLPETLVLPSAVHWHDEPALQRGDVRVWRGARGFDGTLRMRTAQLAERWLDQEDGAVLSDATAARKDAAA